MIATADGEDCGTDATGGRKVDDLRVDDVYGAIGCLDFPLSTVNGCSNGFASFRIADFDGVSVTVSSVADARIISTISIL